MRTYQQAKSFAWRQHVNPSQSWRRKCQLFSRQCVGAASFGPSAFDAFFNIPAAHRFGGPPPAGSIAYYGTGFPGHAVFVIDEGFVWSNDILHRGKIDRVRWDIFPRKWGSNYPYLGWIDWTPSGALDIPGRRPAGRGPARQGFRQGKKVYADKMHLGQKNSDSVWNLQVALISKGFPIPQAPTGFFGRGTLAACSAFQFAQGWRGRNADGIPGPRTIQLLGLKWVPR